MLALIPARGGSKGLPGKNIKNLLGKPMIAYSVEAALDASSIDRVIVSTDCPDIAAIAVEYGAECPSLRPSHLATDNALAIDTYTHALNEFAMGSEEIVVLLPTAPLRTAIDINSAVALFREKAADSVISFTEEHHPVSWHRQLDSDGRVVYEDQPLSNRQDNKTTYYPNGSLFVFTKDILMSGKYYSNNTYAYTMPRNRSVDVDTQEDFEYVEYLLGKVDG